MADISVNSFVRTDTALDTLDQVRGNGKKTSFVDKKGNIAGGTLSVANKTGNNRSQSAVLDRVLSLLKQDIGDLIRSKGGSKQDAARLHSYVLKTASEDFADPLEVEPGKKIGAKTLDKLQHVLDTAVRAVTGFNALSGAREASIQRTEAPTEEQAIKAKQNEALAQRIEDLSDEITEKRSEVDRILSIPESERNRYDAVLLSNWQGDLPNLESKLAGLEAQYAKATRQVTLPAGEQAEFRHIESREGHHPHYTVSSFENQSAKVSVAQWGDLAGDRALVEADPEIEYLDPIKGVEYDNDLQVGEPKSPSAETLENFDDDWEIAFADDTSYEVTIKNPGKRNQYAEVNFTESVVGTKRSVVDAWRGVEGPFRDALKAKIQETAPVEVAAAIISDLEVTWAR